MIVQREWLNMNDQWLDGFRYRIPFHHVPFVIRKQADGGAQVKFVAVPIYIGAPSTGDGEKRDTTLDRVFDEVGDNWQKIAITQADGVTQEPVAKIKWDASAREAIIWFEASAIGRFSADNYARLTTKYYLYYDRQADDNTSYVGTDGDTVCQSVFSDYLVFFHMEEVPDDGTRNFVNFAGTDKKGRYNGTDTNKQITSKSYFNTQGILNWVDFEATTDQNYIDFDNPVSGDLEDHAQMTIYALAEIETRTTGMRIVDYGNGGSARVFRMGINTADHFFVEFRNNDVVIATAVDTTDVIGDGNVFVTGTYNGGSSSGDVVLRLGQSDVATGTPTGATVGNATVTNAPRIGSNTNNTLYWDGRIALVAIMDVGASVDFTRIIDRGLRNDLWVFMETEEKPDVEYQYRLPIHVKSDNVDQDLSGFNVKIFLGTSAGDDDQDVSAVFDELGDVYKKLRITAADGVTILPLEVIYWDSVGELAVMTTTLDLIDSAGGADLFLYFDNRMPASGETVHCSEEHSPPVSSEFNRFRWHAAKQKPNTPELFPVDLPVNGGWLGIDGDQESVGLNDDDLGVDASLGPYIDIGTGEYIWFADNDNFDRTSTDAITVAMLVRVPVEQANSFQMLCKRDDITPFTGWELQFHNTNDNFRFVFDNGASSCVVETTTQNLDGNVWYHVVGWYDGSDTIGGFEIWLDGLDDTTVTLNNFPLASSMANSEKMNIGARGNGFAQPAAFQLQVIEARVYLNNMPYAWIKAQNYNWKDQFVRFAAIESREDTEIDPEIMIFESVPVEHVGFPTIFISHTAKQIEFVPGVHEAITQAQMAMIGRAWGSKPKILLGTGALPHIADEAGP